jgi:predicted glycosyltransferase
VRIWVDITDASAVVFFAPIVRRLEDAGHTVTLTARRFAGADLVLRRYGLGGVLTTQHRGGSLGTRAVGLMNRTAQLLGSASSGRFDVAAGSHASDFVLTAWTLAVPQMTFLESERPGRSNLVNLRLVDEVAVPEAVAVTALTSAGAPADKLFRYPGFREEYYLYDALPDPDALRRLGVERRRIVGVVRPAAPRTRLPSGVVSPAGEAAPAAEAWLTGLLRGLAGRRNLTLIVAARDQGQRRRLLALDLPGVIVPDGPVDGVGLMTAADFVVGLGGAMLREAAALGTPAYTLSSSAGAVEASLLADGRLTRAAGPDDILLRKKDTRTASAPPRDPWLFADRLLELARRRSRRARLGRLVRDAANEPSPPLV